MLGVEINVDFIFVEHRFLEAGLRLEPADGGQSAQASAPRPRAEHDGLGAAKSGADACHGATHRADRDRREAFQPKLFAEKLACPTGSPPSEVRGRTFPENAHENVVEAIVELVLAVSATTVVQARDSFRFEAMRRADDGGGGDVQLRRHSRAGAPRSQSRHRWNRSAV